MGTLQVVTGYVPIQGHPRTAAEYGRSGDEIFGPISQAGVTVIPFYETLGECWMWRHMQSVRTPTTHSVADNPQKNTLAYHCVQHQKFAWLLKAAIKNPAPETLVWIDYGIQRVPGVTVAVIQEFLAKIKPDDFAIPGCWEKQNAFNNDLWPCWRFCGGVMVVPRKTVHKLYKTVKREVLRHIAQTRNVTWEVNTLARIEATLPHLRWYKADHNETLFTGYPDA
jgi:hypothetical protein